MLRSGGETLHNSLTEIWEHPDRGHLWNSHGLTVSDREELHVIPQAKLDDLRKRCRDPEAIPCIIPIIGTPELNHLMWIELKKQLKTGSFKFLIDEQEMQTILEDTGEYYQLSSEALAERLAPYLETTSLVYEAINLNAEWRNDRLKLVENRSATKDKAVVCAYGNYIISKLELQWLKSEQEDDINWDEISWVF